MKDIQKEFNDLCRVKTSRKVKKSETSDFLMTRSFDDMVMNGEKSSYSRMSFDIERLERIEEIVGK